MKIRGERSEVRNSPCKGPEAGGERVGKRQEVRMEGWEGQTLERSNLASQMVKYGTHFEYRPSRNCPWIECGIEESKKNQDKLPDRRVDHMVKRWYHLLRWGRLKQEPIEEERIKPSMRALSSLRCPYRWSC